MGLWQVLESYNAGTMNLFSWNINHKKLQPCNSNFGDCEQMYKFTDKS